MKQQKNWKHLTRPCSCDLFQWSQKCLLLFTALILTSQPADGSSSASALLTSLFGAGANYDSEVRPVASESSAVVVKISIALTQVVTVDERNQLITVTVWKTQSWTDASLTWTPADHGNIASIPVSSSKHWKPDIYLYNAGSEEIREQFTDLRSVLSSDGTVTYRVPMVYTFTCHMDVYFFPFDQHTCSMKFGSWSHNVNELDLQLSDSTTADLSHFESNFAFGIVSFTAEHHATSDACCGGKYADVTLNLTVRRHPTMYVYYIIMPNALLNLLVIFQFFLPCDSGEKISLGVTIMLSFVVYLLLLTDQLPPSNKAPLVVLYLTCTIALVTASQFINISIIHIHHNGRHNKRHTMPIWIRKYILKHFSKALCLRKKITSDEEHQEKMNTCYHLTDVEDMLNSGREKQWEEDIGDETAKHQTKENTVDSTPVEKVMLVEDLEEVDLTNDNIKCGDKIDILDEPATVENKNNNKTAFKKKTKFGSKNRNNFEEMFKRWAERQSSVTDRLLAKLLRVNEEAHKRNLEDDIEEEQDCEWMQLAFIIDRFFFWVYFIGTIVILCAIFVHVPRYTDDIIA